MQTLTTETSTGTALHKEAQRLRWFLGAFERHQNLIERETGIHFRTSRADLTDAFADWLSDFERQKPVDPRSNTAYVGFAAGLMLRALIRHNPSLVQSRADKASESNPAHFWPEGYLYVAFCLGVRGEVLRADYGEQQHPSEDLTDLRTWWSFRENTAQDPSLAIGFLDLFAGCEPAWTSPQIFRANPARRPGTDRLETTRRHLS